MVNRRDDFSYKKDSYLVLCSGAAERILDWVGSKNFLLDEFVFFCINFLTPKRDFPQILGRQLPTLPTRVRRP